MMAFFDNPALWILWVRTKPHKDQHHLDQKGDKIKLSFKDTTPLLPDKPINTFFQGIIA